MTKPDTVLVQQRPNSKDCFIACVAMAEGVSYDELVKRIDPALYAEICAGGTHGRNIDLMLTQCGWARDYHYRVAHGFREGLVPWLREWLFERRAILQVTSVNFAGENHMVYWDGRELHDPSMLKTVTVEDVYRGGVDWAWLLSEFGQ